MPDLYEGTIGEREYASGFDQGYAMGEYDHKHYPATVWNEIDAAKVDAASSQYRTRAYLLGWLRGYRQVVR